MEIPWEIVLRCAADPRTVLTMLRVCRRTREDLKRSVRVFPANEGHMLEINQVAIAHFGDHVEVFWETPVADANPMQAALGCARRATRVLGFISWLDISDEASDDLEQAEASIFDDVYFTAVFSFEPLSYDPCPLEEYCIREVLCECDGTKCICNYTCECW